MEAITIEVLKEGYFWFVSAGTNSSVFEDYDLALGQAILLECQQS